MIQSVKSKATRNTHQVAPKLLNKNDKEVICSAPNKIVPEGYFSYEEFRKIAIEKGHTFCNKHGII